VAVQPALSVREAAWVPHLELLPELALAGVVLGFVLARTRVLAALAHLLVLGLGIEALTVLFGAYGGQPTLREQVEWLSGRVATWLDAVQTGGASNDALLFALTMGAAAWLLGYTSAWLLVREDAAWLTVAANGLALLVNLSYAPPEMGGTALGRFLVAASVLLALHHVLQRQALWESARIRVDSLVGARAVIGALALAVGLLAMSALLPGGGTNVTIASVWQRTSSPWQSFEDNFGRVFASLDSRERISRGVNFGRTLAPRGSFDLSDTPLFEVKSPEPFYWRATTADRYTSQAITSSDTSSVPLEANQALLPDDQIPEGRALAQADIRVVANRSAAALAPDIPVRLSVPVEVDERTGSGSSGASHGSSRTSVSSNGTATARRGKRKIHSSFTR
jgi:hypothetical protein